MIRLLVALAAAVSLTSAADLSGRWTGTFERVKGGPPGGIRTQEHVVVLTQTGPAITGVAGPAEKQWEIRNAKLNGDQLTFEVFAPGPAKLHFTYALRVQGGRMSGTVDEKARSIEWTLTLKRE